mmetsp:Transcript_60078/g.68054  ORF Transcript_60078/g.68054 Transcript_60078/m.68054 type:complete len:488 (+) Transcript_60078:79-1542(+)
MASITPTNPPTRTSTGTPAGASRQPARLSWKNVGLILVFLFSLLYIIFVSSLTSSMRAVYTPMLWENELLHPESNHSHANKPTLPTCKDLMQQPHSPYVRGAFLTRLSTDVTWKMRRDGSRKLTLPSTCQLERYTSNEARQCLKGKKLLFVGDSLTRYNYLSLAYFLEHERWPDRFNNKYSCQIDKASCSKLEPNVCAETDWVNLGGGGWSPYLRNLGGGTDGGIFGGRMEVNAVKLKDPKSYKEPSPSYEYVSSSKHGQTTMWYAGEASWSGKDPYFGYNFSGCAKNATCRYTSQQWDQKQKHVVNKTGFDWRYTSAAHAFGSTGTDFYKQYDDTDYAFYNRGLWGKLPEDKAKIMMESMYKLSGGKEKQQNRCFYRSTTSCGRITKNDLGNYERNTIRAIANSASCEYLDYNHITEAFSQFAYSHPVPDRNIAYELSSVFWDAVHYQPWVYEELNNLLLNVLCNANVDDESTTYSSIDHNKSDSS